ncbi:MAG: VCBS repeat-containing protein, partial [Planctomycetes bacterium]|nr:VCBS repeat-containing protein [Planctomycetota bacterium]
PCAAQGRVRVLSGPDGSLIYSLVGFQCLSFFGSGVTALPDMDGDGTSELVVAARNEVSGAGPFGFGVLRAFSGGLASPGSILWSAAYPTIYQTGYPPVPPVFPTVDDVTRIGDLTGDGVPDLVSSGPDSAERVISGATGALVFLFVPAFYGPGAIVSPPNQRYRWDFDGDVSADGLADLLGASVTGTPWIGSFGPGSVVARSGSNGTPLWFVEPPPPAYGFGWCVVGGEDWDGDGIPDCAVAAPGYGVGRIYVLDGSGGGTRYVIDGPPSAGLVGFGTQVARIDDVNGDGVQEIAASAPLASVGGIGNTGRLYLFTLCDTFGAPCLSSAGLSPRLRCLGGAVTTGNASFGLRLEDAPPGAPTLLLVGLSNTTWGGVALPAPLPASPGCLVRVAGDVLVTPSPGVTSPAGVAQAALPIPSVPGLAGSTLYAQWILLDPGSASFLSSPAVRLPVLP